MMDKDYLYFIKLVKKLNNSFSDYYFNYDYELQAIDIVNKYDRHVDTIIFRDCYFRYDNLLDEEQGMDIIDSVKKYLVSNPYNFR